LDYFYMAIETPSNPQKSSSTTAHDTKTGYFFLAALLVLAALIVSSVVVYYQYTRLQDGKPTSRVSITGQAETKVKYAKATLRFYLTKKGEDVQKLNTEVDDQAKKITDFILSNNIAQSSIQTTKSSYPNYDYSTGGSTQKGVVLEQQFTVKIENLQQNLNIPNTLTQGLIPLGVDRFDAYQYEVGNVNAVCEELKTKAIADARSKAISRIQALGGSTIVRTDVVDGGNCEQNIAPIPYFADAKSAAVSSEIRTGGPDVFTGEKDLKQEIAVIYDYR
jgi:uncharacterized protein YggE